MVTEPHAPANFAALYVEFVRLGNFRGIAECEIELEPTLTLLVGRNNAGKSRILRALDLALGAASAEADDLTVGDGAPATIDIVVAPRPRVPPDDEEIFDPPITQLLITPQTVREEPLRERFAWRTTVRPSAEGFGARMEMQLLVFDVTHQAWTLPSNPTSLARKQRSLFAVHLVDVRRDLVEELTRRGSAIRRVLSDLEVQDPSRSEIEARLSLLGSQIVAESATLDAIRTALIDLEKLVGTMGVPTLNPLPIRLEELARSVAIDLDTGHGSMPVRLHGSGSRSLASLQVQGVLYERRLGRDGPELRPLPLTLIEEPEAHLHPQAHLELAGLLARLPGQVIASTHSSHLVTAIEPKAIRLIRRSLQGTQVIDLGPTHTDSGTTHRSLRPSTHAAEMEMLKRLVERPFGEVLFASAIVMGDGATERAFLPIVLRHALAHKAHGVCVIDPGSLKSELARAAIKFATLADTPWILFSDSDGPGKTDADALVAELGAGNSDHVVWILCDSGESITGDGPFELMLCDFDSIMCREACLEVRPDLVSTASTLELLSKLKGSSGCALGRKLIEHHPDWRRWPSSLCTLIERLDNLL